MKNKRQKIGRGKSVQTKNLRDELTDENLKDSRTYKRAKCGKTKSTLLTILILSKKYFLKLTILGRNVSLATQIVTNRTGLIWISEI